MKFAPVLSRTSLLLVATGVLCFGDISITGTNPFFSLGENSDGGLGHGSPAAFDIQSFTFSDVGTAWTLTIETNYGVNIDGVKSSQPGFTGMPGFCDGGGTEPICKGGFPMFMSDFLIQQGNNYFGIVLSAHNLPFSTDSYLASNLYKVTEPPGTSGFQSDTHFGLGPVILVSGGTKLNTGSGTESAAANPGCNSTTGMTKGGANCAEFTVTDTFTASANFFDPTQPFTLYASSAECDNFSITSKVPEPGGLIYLVPVLLLLGSYLRRRSLARVR